VIYRFFWVLSAFKTLKRRVSGVAQISIDYFPKHGADQLLDLKLNLPDVCELA